VQALGAMLALDDFAAQLSDLEQLAVILAAAIHDVGHPGVNNDFLIRTQSEVGRRGALQRFATTLRAGTDSDGGKRVLEHMPLRKRCISRMCRYVSVCVSRGCHILQMCRSSFLPCTALSQALPAPWCCHTVLLLQAAVAYNDISINENMHAAAGFKLLAKKENNFLSQ
jgi:hypothetical protein